MGTNNDFNKMTPIAQSFLQHLIKIGKPEQWVAPYLVRSNSHGFFNFTTGNQYRGGMNRFILAMSGGNLFAGYKQAKEAGLKMKPEGWAEPICISRPIMSVFYKENDKGEKEKHTYCTGFAYSKVYSIDSFEDSPEKTAFIEKYTVKDADVVVPDLTDRERYDELEARINQFVPVVHNSQNVATSRVDKKLINMPLLENLVSVNEAIRTLLHEAAHAMKHFGAKEGESRGKEEGIAEIASMMMAAEWGYETDMTNTVAYIWGWLGLKSDMFGYQSERKLSQLTEEEQTAVIMLREVFEAAQERLSKLKAQFKILDEKVLETA